MDRFNFLYGLTDLQFQLVQACRKLAEDDDMFLSAKEIIRAVVKMPEAEFEAECEALEGQVEPIGAYRIKSVGYVYRLLLQLGQPWLCRYPFFNMTGMYGDLHDDEPSGPEYVEVRLSDFANTVMPHGKRPLLPIALLNGHLYSEGTRIPAHNLEELWMACENIRQNPEMELADLMEILPGPDFASAGVAGGFDAIRSLYADGGATLTLSAEIITQIEGARTRVVIASLPPGVLIKTVIEQIRSLSQGNRIYLYELKDLSNHNGVEVILDLPRRWSPATLKEILFKETALSRSERFQCSAPDSSESGDEGEGPASLIETLKWAVAQCGPAWERKDGEPLDHHPYLKEILEHGGYKSPLKHLTDRRRSFLREG